MCHAHTEGSPQIRLRRCSHGTFHLTVNGATLHLLPEELTMIGQAINTWARRHPDEVVGALEDLEQWLEP